MSADNNERKPLGELLIDSELVTRETLTQALELMKHNGKKLGDTLIEMGALSERKLLEVLEFQLRIPLYDLSKYDIDPTIPHLINEALARRHQCIPIGKENNQLILAMADPLNLQATDDVRVFTGMSVKPVFALKSEVLAAIDRFYSKEGAQRAAEDFKKEFDIDEIVDSESDQLSDIDNAPVVRLINSILQHAIRLRASDIHIEPFEKTLRFRFRVDGEMVAQIRVEHEKLTETQQGLQEFSTTYLESLNERMTEMNASMSQLAEKYAGTMDQQMAHMQDQLYSVIDDIFTRFNETNTTTFEHIEGRTTEMLEQMTTTTRTVMEQMQEQVTDLGFFTREINSEVNALNDTLRDATREYGEEMRKSMDTAFQSFDEGVGELVQRLSHTTERIRDAVEALPETAAREPDHDA